MLYNMESCTLYELLRFALVNRASLIAIEQIFPTYLCESHVVVL